MTLFEPIKVGAVQLQHRVVLAPMTRLRNDENNVPTELVVEYYRQRANPGGLLITEGGKISDKAGGFPHVPGFYTEQQIEAWRKVTQAVHEKGGYIFAQIWHGGRAGSSLYLDNKPPLAPSPIAAVDRINAFTGKPYEVPRETTKDDIQDIIQQYATAAKDAIKAGFDGVELHGANGFLIHQFLSSSANQRTDEYGGSIPNRARFALQVVDAVIEAVGAERTGIRLSPWGGEEGDVTDGDTTYETYSYLLKQLNPKGIAYVHFVEPRDDFIRETVDLVNSLDPFRDIWQGPFISAGGYTTHPESIAARAKETGDLVAVGRAYIANPDLVDRLKNDWPLNKYKRDTFYAQGAEGYTDYPFYAKA
ncbi:hypothetical protein BDB00DRAFT_847922 [Zychaea mexicana]|uniref:uncharacterized protein n=1 Tax=Zychaea mexicana TaxID=64656 RepID=UPI0022FF03F0|nr:uncharacterized protein BDB00DRAFT_847922 [Zychaea mexicana]KAI9488501.1 hypothetical protein BDB00DRAFT_847922 [Zychaea mexicana]